MKTNPDAPPRQPQGGEVSHTVASSAQAQSEDRTEAVSFTKVKKLPSFDGPVGEIDCKLEFSFEKSRIKAIEHTELFASSMMSINPDAQLVAVKQAEQNIALVARYGQQFDAVTYCLRTFAIIVTLFCTLDLIGTFFAVLLLCLSGVSFVEYIVWVSLETVSDVAFMYISVKITGLNRVTAAQSQPYFKLSLIYCVALIGLIIGVDQRKSFGSAIECVEYAGNDDATGAQRDEGRLCILFIFFFAACIYKMAIMMVYVGLWIFVMVRYSRIARAEAAKAAGETKEHSELCKADPAGSAPGLVRQSQEQDLRGSKA